MRTLLLAGLALLLGVGVAACDSGTADGTARLTVRLTDAPFPFDLAASADVTITRIELLAAEPGDMDDEADDDPETDDSESDMDDETVLDRIVLFDGEPFDVNLLDLRDGVSMDLVEDYEIPADGSYNRLRIFVGEDASVTFTDGTVFDLKLPSAQQSGIKVRLPDYQLDGETGEVDVLIDFDVEKSFVVRGNPASPGFQGFLFKPVLEVESFEVRDREPEDDEPGDEEPEDDEPADDDDGEG